VLPGRSPGNTSDLNFFTRADFVGRLDRLNRRKILLLRVALSCLFVLLLTSMWMTKAHPHDTVHSAFKAVSTLGFMAVVYACLASLQRLGRSLGLYCPHCGGRLTGVLGRKAALAEACVHCGQSLF
jgi:hypothetical protein